MRRQYFGEDMANEVIGWINKTNDRDGSDRVLEVLRCFKSLSSLQENGEKLYRTKRGKSTLAHVEGKMEETVTTVNGLLSNYALVPYVEGMGHLFGTGWKPVPGTLLARKRRQHVDKTKFMTVADMRADGGIHNFDEASALESILVVVRANSIGSIGECSCGLLFFRYRRDSDFCSTTCRLESYKPKRRLHARRRYYLRKNYPNVKGG